MNRELANKKPVMLKADLNQIVERFESGWSTTRDVGQFLPATSVANFSEIFCELVRVDLEFRWQNGEPTRIENYLDRFPSVKLTEEEISQIAFEEYRVRNQFGQPCSAQSFTQRHGIDVSHWPALDKQDERSTSPVSTKSRLERIRFPKLGERFHKFELVAILGQGAFGRVYLARQSDLANRFIVVKITEISDTEPQTLARLQHTNIVPIHSLRRDEKLQSICMPFLGLVTLQDLIRQTRDGESRSYSGRELISTVAGKRASTVVGLSNNDGSDNAAEIESVVRVDETLTPAIAGLNFQDLVLWMFGRIADGLAYSHARGVIHGDMKPANVLISDDGQPLLLDFHLASQRSGHERSLVGGTLPYMSSSHLKSLSSESSIDERCDLFSVGVMLYEAITGRLPYPDRESNEFAIPDMIRDRSSPPSPVKDLVPEISTDMSSIIEHCLSPHDHYRSADELSTDIARHLVNLPLKYAPNRSWTERISKWSRRHPRLSSGTMFVAFGIVVTAVAAILIGSRLSQSARTNAIWQSDEFVKDISSATQPLTLGRNHGIDLEKNSQALSELLTARTTSKVDYRRLMANLPNDVRAIEEAAVVDSRYWLAWTLQFLGSNSNPGPKQQELLTQANEEIQNVTEMNGSTPLEFLRLQANIYRQLGDAEESQRLLSRIEDQDLEGDDSDEFASQLLKAAECRRNKQDDKALQLLSSLVEADPYSFPTWLIQGHSYLDLGKIPNAIASYSMCIGLDKSSPWGFFSRGIAHLENRDYLAAKTDFDQCIELDSSSTSFYMNRALAFRGLKQPEQAIQDVTTAIEMGCPETRALYIRCQLLRQIGREEQAQWDFDEFLSQDPKDEKSWLSRGMAQIEINRPDKALSDFNSALKLQPRSQRAFQNIATVQAEYLGQTESAIEALTEIIRDHPRNETAIATRGVLYARIGDRDQAHKDAQQALIISRSADTTYRVAGIFALTAKSNDQDAAIAHKLLRKAALANGGLVLSRIGTDKDLDGLRGTDPFKQLVETLGSWKR